MASVGNCVGILSILQTRTPGPLKLKKKNNQNKIVVTKFFLFDSSSEECHVSGEGAKSKSLLIGSPRGYSSGLSRAM